MASWDRWLSGALPAPWGDRPSLYGFLSALPDDADSAVELPDADRLEEGEVRWAAGAMDGVGAYHMGIPDSVEEAALLAAVLSEAAMAPAPDRVAKLYEDLLQVRALEVVDPLLEQIRASDTSPDGVWGLARWLATRAPDREPVKLGMAMLGILVGTDDREVLRTLGRHDELTLFAAVALAATSPEPDEDLMWLARRASGWGRIHTIHRLSGPLRREHRDWLLREGWECTVMPEYIALACAMQGDLAGALEPPRIDAALLRGACGLLDVLAAGTPGPFATLADWDRGPVAVERLLRHLPYRATEPVHLRCARALHAWLVDEDADQEAREEQGWTREQQERLAATCAEIIADPAWTERLETLLREGEGVPFAEAVSLAEAQGIDAWETLFERQQMGDSLWFPLSRTEDPERMRRLVALLVSEIDLAAVASGPGTEMGLGPEYAPHVAVEAVVRGLARFPGEGWEVVRASLHSAVIRNRHAAIQTLAAWGRAAWSPEMVAALGALGEADPDEGVRAAAAGTLDPEQAPDRDDG